MTKIQNPKPIYDLEERTFQFAKIAFNNMITTICRVGVHLQRFGH
jgi:hypothetical protein